MGEFITHWSDSSVIVVIVCSGSRIRRPQIQVCVEGKGGGRFDRGVVSLTRNPQQSRVYVLEEEIIYVQQVRGSAETENWRLPRPHTWILVSPRDIESLDERFWSKGRCRCADQY